MTEKVARELKPGDMIRVSDLGHEQNEEVLFRAWSDDGDVLIWTDFCDVAEPIRLDGSAMCEVGAADD